MSAGAIRRKSDQHPAVRQYRQKLASLGENQLTDIRSLGARVEQLRADCASAPPAAREGRDSRRDDMALQRGFDPRRENNGEVPVDVVGDVVGDADGDDSNDR